MSGCIVTTETREGEITVDDLLEWERRTKERARIREDKERAFYLADIPTLLSEKDIEAMTSPEGHEYVMSLIAVLNDRSIIVPEDWDKKCNRLIDFFAAAPLPLVRRDYVYYGGSRGEIFKVDWSRGLVSQPFSPLRGALRRLCLHQTEDSDPSGAPFMCAGTSKGDVYLLDLNNRPH
ncbi:hypothetical protein KIPB_003867, partial [Kipferlia bialata]|eukprot:g3867.t1